MRDKHTMRVLNSRGDSSWSWDPRVETEVASVGAQMLELIANGHTAFEVGPDGKAVGRLSSFNPDAHEIVLVRNIQGG